MTDIFTLVAELTEKGETFCLATVIRSTGTDILPGKKALIREDGVIDGSLGSATLDSELTRQALSYLNQKKSGSIELESGVDVFLNIISSEAALLICGAGHIAVPVAQFSNQIGFRVTVLDDRPDFANVDRFPNCQVRAEDFVSALQKMDLGPTSYAVVITRGHEYDVECLREILKKVTAYVGLIGSRRRVRVVLDSLKKEGISPEQLQAVFTPIGLPIGGESPAEIALSIVSELLCVRREGLERARALRAVTGVKP